MKELESIVGIYNFFNPQPLEQSESYYYLLYILDEKGALELDEAKALFNENFKSDIVLISHKNSKLIGPFSTVEKLDQYAFALCEHYNAAKINLLSVDEYNGLLENHQEAELFHKDVLEKGNVITNIERKKKGILSRFFS